MITVNVVNLDTLVFACVYSKDTVGMANSVDTDQTIP